MGPVSQGRTLMQEPVIAVMMTGYCRLIDTARLNCDIQGVSTIPMTEPEM